MSNQQNNEKLQQIELLSPQIQFQQNNQKNASRTNQQQNLENYQNQDEILSQGKSLSTKINNNSQQQFLVSSGNQGPQNVSQNTQNSPLNVKDSSRKFLYKQINQNSNSNINISNTEGSQNLFINRENILFNSSQELTKNNNNNNYNISGKEKQVLSSIQENEYGSQKNQPNLNTRPSRKFAENLTKSIKYHNKNSKKLQSLDIKQLPAPVRSTSQKLYQKIGGLLGLSVIEDQDNFIQDISNQKNQQSKVTYLAMGNMMKGDLDNDDNQINDFEQIIEDQKKKVDIYGNETQDLNDEDFEYQIQLISMDGFQKDNQLLSSQPKNDFELLYQYADPYPLLEVRKIINLITISISYICYSIISHKYFDTLILLIILFNSIMLMISDPTKEETNPTKLAIETFFLIAYACECVLKIIGLGFIFKKNSYLRDGWNILDFIIVVSSILPFILGSDSGVSLTALRSLRILRPLKSVSNIRNLKVILITLFGAFKDLVSTIIILVFFFLIFAIGGLQMFMGLLKRRCFDELTGIPHPDDIICGNKECPEDYICGKMLENPNWGVTNFDNISYAFLMVFQCVTMEGWTEIMYWLFDAFSIFVVFYFVLLVFIGSFFLLNLTLAVIKAKFTDTQTDVVEEVEEEYHIDILMLKNWRKQERLYKQKVLKKRNNKLQQQQYGQTKPIDPNHFLQIQQQCDFTWEGMQLNKIKQQNIQEKKDNWNNSKKQKLSLTVLHNFEEQEKQKIKDVTQKFQRQKQANQALKKYVKPQQRLIYHKREAGNNAKRTVNFLGIQKNSTLNSTLPQNDSQFGNNQQKNMKQSTDSVSTQDWVKNMNDFIDENQFKVLPAFKSQQNNLNNKNNKQQQNNNKFISIQQQSGPNHKNEKDITNLSPNSSLTSNNHDSEDFPNIDDYIPQQQIQTARESSKQSMSQQQQDISILQLKQKNKKSSIYEFATKNSLALYDTDRSNFQSIHANGNNSQQQQQQIPLIEQYHQQNINSNNTSNNINLNNNLITFGQELQTPDKSQNNTIRDENRKPSNISLRSNSSQKKDAKENTQREFMNDSDFMEKKDLKLFKDIDEYLKEKNGVQTNYVCKSQSDLNSEKKIFSFNEEDIQQTNKKNYRKYSLKPNVRVNLQQKRYTSVQPKRKSSQKPPLNSQQQIKSQQQQSSQLQKQKSHKNSLEVRNEKIQLSKSGSQNENQRRIKIKNKGEQIHIGSHSQIEDSVQNSQISISESDVDSEIERKQEQILKKKQQWEEEQQQKMITQSTDGEEKGDQEGNQDTKQSQQLQKQNQKNIKIKHKEKSQKELEKEELDKKNVFKWKIIVNTQTQYTSSSYEDVLEHDIQQKEADMMKEELEKINNQKYRLKYRLKRKPKEPPKKKKMKKSEIDQLKAEQKLKKEQQKQQQKQKLETALKSRQSVFIQLQSNSVLQHEKQSFSAKLLTLYDKNVFPKVKSERISGLLYQQTEKPTPQTVTLVEKEKIKKPKRNREFFQENQDDIQITYRNIRRLIRQPIAKNGDNQKIGSDQKLNKRKSVENLNKNQYQADNNYEKKDEQSTQVAIINSNKDSNCNLKDDLKGQFLLISKNDYDTGLKKDYIWSGNDVIKELGDYKHQNQILNVLSSENQDYMIWIKGFLGLIIVCHKHLRNFVNGDLFNSTLTLAVMLNTIVLAMDGLFQDKETNDMLSDWNTFFTYLFIVEMGLKLIGLTPVGYVRDKMNIFDGCIVILSIFELIFFSGENSAVSAFRALRIFRVLRVTRLLRGMAFMAKIIIVIAKTIDQFVWVAVLLFIFIFIYSLLGMQIYGGKFDFEDNENSAIVIFQLITMENWQQILHLCLRSDVFKFLSALFLISWIWIGSFVFLNLFLSILLDGFGADDLDENYDDDDGDIYEDEDKVQQSMVNMLKIGQNEEDEFQNMQLAEENEGRKQYFLIRLPTEEEEEIKNQIILDKQKHLKPLFHDIKCKKSLFFLSQKNRLRILCYKICVHGHFEHVILTFIIISSLKLVVDTYFKPGSDEIKVSEDIDIFFNTVFAIECILKVISFGFIIDQNSYLQDSWNRLDFFIVVSSIIDMSFESVNVPVIKILRLLRTLRPLRFISHNKNMKIVVIALLESVTPIINVMVVIGMIWIMFAILGISLIGGRMGYCAVPEGESYYEISKEECLEMGHKWKRWDTNFDNIFTAMNTLFVISSLEGWPDYMFLAVDSQPETSGPVKDSYYIISLYYVIFILIGSFFLVNLFVGVIFMHFNEAQKNEKVCALFTTPEQERWIEFQQMILGVKAQFSAHKQPDNTVRKYCYKLAINPWFDGIIMVCIILNIVTMGMVYEGSSVQYNEILDIINYIFTFVFIFELIIKVTGFGFKGFWVSSWNRFDAFVVVASIIDLVMEQLGGGIPLLRVGPQLARVMRVLRVSRLLKLVKSMKSLHKIIETLIFCMPSLINVGALLLLFFFIFSVLGVFTFRDVTEGDAIDNYNNFSNFGYAMLTLFRCATGEDWALFMFDLARQDDDCVQGVNCGSDFAIPYFLLFILFTQFIMLNLFIMIIIQFFEDYSMKEGNPLETFNEQLEIYRNYWSKYSAWSNGAKIKKRHITSFLSELPNPLGYGPNQNDDAKEFQVIPMAEIYRDVMSWNLEDDGEGNIYFNEILYGCMKKAYGIDQMDSADNELKTFVQKLETETKLKIEENKKKQKQKNSQQAFLAEANAVNETATGTKRVNPMVLYLFTLMAYKGWKKYNEQVNKGEEDNSESEYEDDDEFKEEQADQIFDSPDKSNQKQITHQNSHISRNSQSPINTNLNIETEKIELLNQQQSFKFESQNTNQQLKVIVESDQKEIDYKSAKYGIPQGFNNENNNNYNQGNNKKEFQQNKSPKNNFQKYQKNIIKKSELYANDDNYSQISDKDSDREDNQLFANKSQTNNTGTQLQSDSSKIAFQKISENNKNAYRNNTILIQSPSNSQNRNSMRRQSVLDIGLLKNQILQQNEAMQKSKFKQGSGDNLQVNSRKNTSTFINEELIQKQAQAQRRQMQLSEFSQENMLKSNMMKSKRANK